MPAPQTTETKIHWKPNPGPQTEALGREEKEVLYGGARGGGKTDWGIIKILLPVLAKDEHGNPKYPHYRALVLRRNTADLDDWIDRAFRIYKEYGAKKTGKPATFEWSWGAKIVTSHLDTKDSYEKYQGQEFQRILIEEATQIPEESWFERIAGSCRSTIEGLDGQLLLTANPGNAGHAWVRKRFIHVFGTQDENGNWILAQDEKGNPMNGATKIPQGWPFYVPKMREWRIFVPARVDDNPKLKDDYIAFLESLPDALRKAWRYGDWDAFVGQYFPEFRPFGPLDGDPPNARHVIPAGSVDLQPWWTRWMGMDWGYNHPTAVYWACKNPGDGRIHIYRELVVKATSSVEIGALIAKRTTQDLYFMVDPFMVLSIDPSAWGRRDEGPTIAEHIAEGIDQVLGLGTARLMTLDGEIVDSTGKKTQVQESNLGAKKPHIVIRPAMNPRVEGWNHIRELLRFNPLFGFEAGLGEILPKLLIWDCCPMVIDCLASLVHDESKPEDVQKISGDDPADGLRYTLMAAIADSIKTPLSVYMAQKFEQVSTTHPEGMDMTTAYMVARKAEADYKKLDLSGRKPVYSVPRLSRRGKLNRLTGGFTRSDWGGLLQ